MERSVLSRMMATSTASMLKKEIFFGKSPEGQPTNGFSGKNTGFMMKTPMILTLNFKQKINYIFWIKFPILIIDLN